MAEPSVSSESFFDEPEEPRTERKRKVADSSLVPAIKYGTLSTKEGEKLWCAVHVGAQRQGRLKGLLVQEWTTTEKGQPYAKDSQATILAKEADVLLGDWLSSKGFRNKGAELWFPPVNTD